jgi:uncharacterized membrane protein YkoI
MTLAFAFIECARGLVSSAYHSINQVQGVIEAHAIKSGTDYDLLVKVQAKDDKELKATITSLKSIVGIAAVAVSTVYGGAQ